MNNTAIIFPGQGSQQIKMLNDFYKSFKEIQIVFEHANDILKYNIWHIINNKEKILNNNKFTQLAIFISSIAIWKLLNQFIEIRPIAIAGSSLGEYSALTCANVINFENSIKLIQKRSILMHKAINNINEYGMGVIIGINEQDVIDCCEEVKNKKLGIVEIANYNSDKQTVISGEKSAIKIAQKIAKKKGALLTKLLKVNVPSHCSLMKIIKPKFKQYLSKVEFNKPTLTIIHNVNAKSYNNPEDIKNIIIKQLYKPIKWKQTIKKMLKLGAKNIIECGPNKILTNINKRTEKNIKHFNTQNITEFNNIINANKKEKENDIQK